MYSSVKKITLILFCMAITAAFAIFHSEIVTSESDVAHIHSITELNTISHSPDSHDGETHRSTLELDYRTLIQLTAQELGTGTAHYPRIKRLQDGSYILFYNSHRAKEDCLYIKSRDLVNWTEPKCVFEHNDTYNYATTDAVVLSNGDILVCAAKKPISGSAYTGNMEASSLVTKRSSDNGVTWSEEATVYTGMVWEPSLLELDSGEIQIYFTSTATYTELYGYNNDVRSSGSSIIRSYDGGYTWTPNVTAHNIDENDPYAAWRVMQQKIGTVTATNRFTGVTEDIDWFNDQMPVAVQLNNGSIAMVVESYLHFAPHPVNGGLYQLSVGFSHDNWAAPLGRTEEGPADKLLNIDRAAGPYIRQFRSGEVIITHTNSTAKIEYKVCDPTVHEIGIDRSINTGTSTLWSASEIKDGHRIIFVTDDGNNTADVEAKVMEISVCELSLNHNITAYSQSTIHDGRSDDWTENTESLFIGSMSQAQFALRSSYDSDNVYFMVEVLDEYLSNSDYIELKLAADTTSTKFYTVKANHTKLISSDLPSSVTVKNSVVGTIGNDSDIDVGYIIEIKVNKSDLSKIGFTDELYILPTLYNTDGATTYDYDSISGANIKTTDKTLCPKISYTGIRTYQTVYVSSKGNNDACGNTESNPVLSLERAAQILEGKGTVILLDDITITSDLYLRSSAESISIRGISPSVTINCAKSIYAFTDLEFDNISINSTADAQFIYMQYNDLKIGNNVTCTKDASTMLGIIGGFYANNKTLSYSETCSDQDCTIEINSGKWRYIRGGNRRNGTSAPLGHYSGNTTIIINGGVFEATSTKVTDDVSAPTGMNSSSGQNKMIINGGTFNGMIYVQSRSGGIATSADGFTRTPDYSGRAEVIYCGGSIKKGISSSQTIGYPDSNITYPYNTHISVTTLDTLSDTVISDGYDSINKLAYAISVPHAPTSAELDGAEVEYYYYGGKVFLPYNTDGKVLVVYSNSSPMVYLLDNEAHTYHDTPFTDAFPTYVGTAVRTQGSAGLRFKSKINFSSVTDDFRIIKVGSIAAFHDTVEEQGLTFKTEKMGDSIAYDADSLIERWYSESDNGDKIFTAALVNFSEAEYTRDVSCRPYVVFEFNGTSYNLYGHIVTRSVYSVSKQCTGADSANEFIQSIIAYCDGKDTDIDHSFFD